MASANLFVVLAILLVLQFNTAISDPLSPLLSPFLDQVCEDVECGKGTCKSSLNYAFNFICECDPGWKQTRDNETDYKFLPCVIPNCSLDYSCVEAPPPVPAKEIPFNESFFDPCYWIYCGEGSCNQETKYKHTCQCKAGYENLLNVTAFPCFSECTIGSDCSKLGIKVSNQSTSSSVDSGSQGSSILPGNFYILITLAMSLAMVLQK